MNLLEVTLLSLVCHECLLPSVVGFLISLTVYFDIDAVSAGQFSPYTLCPWCPGKPSLPGIMRMVFHIAPSGFVVFLFTFRFLAHLELMFVKDVKPQSKILSFPYEKAFVPALFINRFALSADPQAGPCPVTLNCVALGLFLLFMLCTEPPAWPAPAPVLVTGALGRVSGLLRMGVELRASFNTHDFKTCWCSDWNSMEGLEQWRIDGWGTPIHDVDSTSTYVVFSMTCKKIYNCCCKCQPGHSLDLFSGV